MTITNRIVRMKNGEISEIFVTGSTDPVVNRKWKLSDATENRQVYYRGNDKNNKQMWFHMTESEGHRRDGSSDWTWKEIPLEELPKSIRMAMLVGIL
jgi:hypothetical protein